MLTTNSLCKSRLGQGEYFDNDFFVRTLMKVSALLNRLSTIEPLDVNAATVVVPVTAANSAVADLVFAAVGHPDDDAADADGGAVVDATGAAPAVIAIPNLNAGSGWDLESSAAVAAAAAASPSSSPPVVAAGVVEEGEGKDH